MIEHNDPTPGVAGEPVVKLRRTPVLEAIYDTAAGPLTGLMPEFFADKKWGGVQTVVADAGIELQGAVNQVMPRVKLLIVQNQTVSLPLSAKLTDDDVEDVIRAVTHILRNPHEYRA